jgi:hypothetical protein
MVHTRSDAAALRSAEGASNGGLGKCPTGTPVNAHAKETTEGALVMAMLAAVPVSSAVHVNREWSAHRMGSANCAMIRDRSLTISAGRSAASTAANSRSHADLWSPGGMGDAIRPAFCGSHQKKGQTQHSQSRTPDGHPVRTKSAMFSAMVRSVWLRLIYRSSRSGRGMTGRTRNVLIDRSAVK